MTAADEIPEARNVMCSGIGEDMKADSKPTRCLKRVKMTSFGVLQRLESCKASEGRYSGLGVGLAE